MPKLVKREQIRLFLVSEFPDDRGLYTLDSLDMSIFRDYFEQEINADMLDGDMLNDRLGYLYKGSVLLDVDWDFIGDDDGYLHYQTDAYSIHIPDITEMIDTDLDPRTLTCYIAMDSGKSKYRWIVAELQWTYFHGVESVKESPLDSPSNMADNSLWKTAE